MERMSAAEFQKKVAAGKKWQLMSEKSAAKYHNKRATVGLEKFHSQMEADDFMVLSDHVKRKEIRNLKRQVRFKLYAWEYHITDALVDFQFEMPDGTIVWYETKGMVTDRFQILKKLIVANLPAGHLYIINREELEIYLKCYHMGKPYAQRRY